MPRDLGAWTGLAGFYASSFAVLGVYMQFFPAWLHEVRGFDEKDVAIVLAAPTVSRTIAGPLWSRWADRSRDARRVLTVLATGALAAFLLFAVASSVAIACCVAFAFGCLYAPMLPILDATAVRAADRHGFSFGRLRVAGSSAFLVAVVGTGALLERIGTEAVLPLLVVVLAATALAARRLPRAGAADRDDAGAAASPVSSWLQLFRSLPFVLVLISAALIQGSHAVYYNLSTVHWSAHGIDKTLAGLLWAEGVFAEIAVLFYARHTLERLRPTTLLLVGAGGAMVRWAVVASTTSVPVLFCVNWLHALSFAATYLGAIRAVQRRVPPHLRTTAQGLLGAAQAGLGMVVCGLVGGYA